VKKVYQNIYVKPINIFKGKLKIYNEFFFTDLKEFKIFWNIKEDGKLLQKGMINNFNLGPQHSKILKIPFKKPNINEGAEYWLNINIKLKNDTVWSNKGHIISFEQFKIPYKTKKPPKQKIKNPSNISLKETESAATLKGENFIIEFNKIKGIINKLKYGDNLIIIPKNPNTGGPFFNAFRAPTDNNQYLAKTWLERQKENGLSKKQAIELAKKWYSNRQIEKLLNQNSWFKSGLQDLKRKVTDFRIKKIENKNLIINIQTINSGHQKNGFKEKIEYTINGNGWIKVNTLIESFGDLPVLSCIGHKIIIMAGYENLIWYGRGPHENYPDRKTGSPVDVYKSTVSKQYIPYIMPQETGNKEDTRWLALYNNSGKGVQIKSKNIFSFSTLYFSDIDLYKAKHTCDLKPKKEIYITIDRKQLGLGNGSCGPGVLDKYLVKPGNYEFSYTIKPYTK